MKKILEHIDDSMPDLISDLQTLIRQPSVSAKNEGIEKCAQLVSKMLRKSGIKSEILRLKGASPLVYGEIKSKKTLTEQYYFTIIMMYSPLSLLSCGMILPLVAK